MFFSSYLVIFPATLPPFCQSGSHFLFPFFAGKEVKPHNGVKRLRQDIDLFLEKFHPKIPPPYSKLGFFPQNLFYPYNLWRSALPYSDLHFRGGYGSHSSSTTPSATHHHHHRHHHLTPHPCFGDRKDLIGGFVSGPDPSFLPIFPLPPTALRW